MPSYLITERRPAWITTKYRVEAENEAEAREIFEDGDADQVGEPEIGDNLDSYMLTDADTSVDLEEPPAQPSGFDASPGDPPLRVDARAHSDDYHVNIKFDAAGWFAQAPDDEIVSLAKVNWGGDYEADAVAEHFEHSTTQRLFDYLSTKPTMMGSDDPVGFECHVDADQAVAWLHRHRPELAQSIEGMADEGIA
jgi:hypothetical protein